jgi:glycosyltransferase involved in cell wall biosynthesis
MHVWLVKLEEQLPLDENYRPYRMGMLANALLERGHSVTRWCSDFNHLSGEYRFGEDQTVVFTDSQTFELLNSGIRYRKPVSLLRLLDNLYLSHKFKRKALKKAAPDLIVCSMPTPELAKVSSDISIHFNVPLIIDARDFWPDIFDNELTGLKKLLAKPIIFLMKKNLKKACANAISLVGITAFYKDHLLNYSGREATEQDAVFPLGFDQRINLISEDEAKDLKSYWSDKIGTDLDSCNKKIVYFAGRLNSTVFMAIDPVLDAAKYFEKKGSEYLFILCGSGQCRDLIMKKISGLKNVILPGEVSSKSLSYLRSKSYLAIQPIENRVDYMNSLSNKFFEYTSSGLPILTSLTGITREVIETKKLGYAYSGSDQLINCLLELGENKVLRNEMSENANKVFLIEYSSDVVYQAFAKHCEKIFQTFFKSR